MLSINKYIKCFSGVNKINIELFANGKPVNLKDYDDNKILAIENAIKTLWKSKSNSAVWFEIETYEYNSLFRRNNKVEMQVTCYTHDKYNIVHKKKKMYVPRSYIKKYVSESGLITINPISITNIPFKEKMQVRFYLKA
jgi:hypothetical protein